MLIPVRGIITSLAILLVLAYRGHSVVAVARVPEHIRGFGHVKARHLVVARQQWAELKDRFDQSTP